MASTREVPSGRLLTMTIKGHNLIGLTRKVSIRESICTSYLSGEIVILDHNNFIVGLGIIGLDPVKIVFDAPIVGDRDEAAYECDMYVLSVNAEASPENLRSIIYNIAIVGGEYFTDRGNIVTESTNPGTTGVALSHKIWGKCGFPSSLITPVSDSPLQDGDQPFHVDMAHPFTAIAQIRDAMNFPAYPEGNVLLYRDRYVENLVPLKYLFDILPIQQVFQQTATAGTDWRDMFNMNHIIIEAKLQTRGSGTTGMGGGGGAQDVAATASQGIKKFDAIAGKLINNMVFGKAIAGVVFPFSKYGLGGSPNLAGMNSNNRPQETDFTAKIPKERAYAAMVKAGPQYNIRVPLRTGIKCTVGKGATFNLLPSGGEQWEANQEMMKILPMDMLITDLVHDVFNDMKLIRGTTTMQCMRGLLT